MACGKPPNPGSMRSPSHLRHPVAQPAHATLRAVDAVVRNNPPGEIIDEAIGRAERCLERARKAGMSEEDLKRLEGQVETLKGLAQSRLRDNVNGAAIPRVSGEKGTSAQQVLDKFSEQSAERNVPTVIRAFESENHWRSKEYKEQLIKTVEGNEKIPTRYKDQLPRDVADVLRVCPNAAGLVRELTLQGQRGATGSRSKLGSKGNSAIGSAYELMGTAALTRKVSIASNTGAKLFINRRKDIVTFGDKSNINTRVNGDGKQARTELPTRKSIECDIRIGRTTIDGFREIGVDFKHVKDDATKSTSREHKNQVENVVKAIQDGQLHEYHFVTNGKFSEKFKDVVNAANALLPREGTISCHEHFTSLLSDPLANGEVGLTADTN